jgi:hypothetical protein
VRIVTGEGLVASAITVPGAAPYPYARPDERKFIWNKPTYQEEITNECQISEVLPVRLPEGARQELAQIAERRYQTVGSIARQAIMREIELARTSTPAVRSQQPKTAA